MTGEQRHFSASAMGWHTLDDCLQYVHQQLLESPCFYGHGTDNAWDEAVNLVFDTLQLPQEIDPVILQQSATDYSEAALGLINTRLGLRLTERVPLPYLTGIAYFAGLPFVSDERALIPRSPLAELILQDFAPWLSSEPDYILDLCCGGGCIGLATLLQFPQARAHLVDIDTEALAQAAANVAKHELCDRTILIEGDLFSACGDATYDLILCNPPYVDAEDLADMPAEFLHEPALALAAGADGLDLIRRVLAEACDFLSLDGVLIAEVGNSWMALQEQYPAVPFLWIDFEHGGHGVFMLSREELLSHRESFA